MKFDLDYFIAKFEAIPDEKWCRGSLLNQEGQSCALGHCGVGADVMSTEDTNWTDEGRALQALTNERIWMVNDSFCSSYNEYGQTPKERVINYLKELKGKT